MFLYFSHFYGMCLQHSVLMYKYTVTSRVQLWKLTLASAHSCCSSVACLLSELCSGEQGTRSSVSVPITFTSVLWEPGGPCHQESLCYCLFLCFHSSFCGFFRDDTMQHGPFSVELTSLGLCLPGSSLSLQGAGAPTRESQAKPLPFSLLSKHPDGRLLLGKTWSQFSTVSEHLLSDLNAELLV